MEEQPEEEELTVEQLQQMLDKIDNFNNLKRTQIILKKTKNLYRSAESRNQELRCSIISLEQQLNDSIRREQYETLQENYNTLQVEYNEKVNMLSKQYQAAHKALEKMTAECDRLKSLCPSVGDDLNTACDDKKKQRQQRQKNKTGTKEELENKYKDAVQNFKEKQRECGTLRDELDSLTENYKVDKLRLENELSCLKMRFKYVEKTRSDLQNDKEKMHVEIQTLREKLERLKCILPAGIDEDSLSSMPVIDKESKKQTKDVSSQTDLQNQIESLKNTHRFERAELEEELKKKECEIVTMKLSAAEQLQEIQNLMLENKMLKDQTPFRDLGSQDELTCNLQDDIGSDVSMTSDDAGRLLEQNVLSNGEAELPIQSFGQNLCYEENWKTEKTILQNELSNKDDEISRHLQTIKTLKSMHCEEAEALESRHHQKIKMLKSMHRKEVESLHREKIKTLKRMEKSVHLKRKLFKRTHHKKIIALKRSHQSEIKEIRGEMEENARKEMDTYIELLPESLIDTLVGEMTVPTFITPLSPVREEEITETEQACVHKETSRMKRRRRMYAKQRRLDKMQGLYLKIMKNVSRMVRYRCEKIMREKFKTSQMCIEPVPSEVHSDSTLNNLNRTELYDSLYEKPQGSVDSGCVILKFFSSSEDEDEAPNKSKEVIEVISGSKYGNIVENDTNEKRKIGEDTKENSELSTSKCKKAKLHEEITENDENIEEYRSRGILKSLETFDELINTITASNGNIEEIGIQEIPDEDQRPELLETRLPELIEVERETFIEEIIDSEENRIGGIREPSETIDHQDQSLELSGTRSSELTEAEKAKPVEKVTGRIANGEEYRFHIIPELGIQEISDEDQRPELLETRLPELIETEREAFVEEIIDSEENRIGGIPEPNDTIDHQDQSLELSGTRSSELTEAEKAKPVEKITRRIANGEDCRIHIIPELGIQEIPDEDQSLELSGTRSSELIEAEKTDLVEKITERIANGEEYGIHIIPEPFEIIGNQSCSQLSATNSTELVRTQKPKLGIQIVRNTSIGEISAPKSPPKTNNDKRNSPIATRSQNKRITKSVADVTNKQSTQNVVKNIKKPHNSKLQKLHEEANITEILLDNEPPAKRTRRALSSTSSKSTDIVDGLENENPNKLNNDRKEKVCKTVNDSKNKKVMGARKTVNSSKVTQPPSSNAKTGKLSDEQIALREKSILLFKAKAVNSNSKDESTSKRSFKRPNKSKSVIIRENKKTETCDNSSNVGKSLELFESPLSPEPQPILDYESAITIIPLEKTQPKVTDDSSESEIVKMQPEVADDSSESGIVLSDGEDRNESICDTKKETVFVETMKKKLQYLMQFSHNKGAVEQVVAYFLDKPVQQTAKAFIKTLRRDWRNEVKPTSTPRAPPVTKRQEILLDFVIRLERRGVKDIMDRCLEALERSLFCCHNIDELDPYARVHVAICLYKVYYTRMRLVLSQALATMESETVLPYVYIVLRSWPKLIPRNDDAKLGPYDMLEVRALLQVIKLKKVKRDFAICCRTNLMLLLISDFYGFKSGVEDNTVLLRELFAAYLKGISDSITYLTMTICKEIQANVVFNLINELKPQLIKSNDVPEICSKIKLIGMIMSLFSENKAAAKHVESNKEFLKMYCTELYPKSVQELAVTFINRLTNG